MHASRMAAIENKVLLPVLVGSRYTSFRITCPSADVGIWKAFVISMTAFWTVNLEIAPRLSLHWSPPGR